MTLAALAFSAQAYVYPSSAVRPAGARTVDVNIRHYPTDVPSVSSKSERATTCCSRCGTSIRYDRTHVWDTRGHCWVETTKEVPELCRKCQQQEKAQEKLNREERKLDAEINYLETKTRIREKKARAARLRQGR